MLKELGPVIEPQMIQTIAAVAREPDATLSGHDVEIIASMAKELGSELLQVQIESIAELVSKLFLINAFCCFRQICKIRSISRCKALYQILNNLSFPHQIYLLLRHRCNNADCLCNNADCWCNNADALLVFQSLIIIKLQYTTKKMPWTLQTGKHKTVLNVAESAESLSLFVVGLLSVILAKFCVVKWKINVHKS